MADYYDPGWGGALRGIVHFWTAPRRPGVDGLTWLRRTQLGLVASLFLFLIALAIVAPWERGNAGATPVAVALFGAACLLRIVLIRRRPLRGDTLERLAISYRARFFRCVGLAEAPALVGILGTFVAHGLWIYLVGLPISLGGHALTAPTRRNIERRQREIQALGSPFSLGQALMDQTPPGRN